MRLLRASKTTESVAFPSMMSVNVALRERRRSDVVSRWVVDTVALSRVWKRPRLPAPALVMPKESVAKTAISSAEVRYFKNICLKIQ